VLHDTECEPVNARDSVTATKCAAHSLGNAIAIECAATIPFGDTQRPNHRVG